jgi:hypothetical protein
MLRFSQNSRAFLCYHELLFVELKKAIGDCLLYEPRYLVVLKSSSAKTANISIIANQLE